jgi:bacteriorhodopsin
MEQKYSTGVRWILYILSFLIWLVGLIAGIVLMTKDDEESKQVGKNCLISMIIGLVLYCVCFLCYFFGMGGLIAASGSSALLLPLV